jgi:hypothetical protein
LGPIDLFKAEDIKQIERFNDEMDLLIKQMQVTSLPTLSYAARLMGELNKRIDEGSKTLGGGGWSRFFSTLSVGLMSPAFAIAELFGESKPVTPEAKSQADKYTAPRMQYEQIVGQKFSLGGSQDSLARIGGFTGFQSSQDTAIKQAIEQTLQLKQIAKSTEKTAQVISRD